MMTDKSPIKSKTYPDCAIETYQFIRTNYHRIPKQELIHLAYGNIFYYEYKIDQNIWTSRINTKQFLLQCVDNIVGYLEKEKEANIRDLIFDILFGDIYHNQLVSIKTILQMLTSYAISLEAINTLECISKWIIINIGNEIIQNMFNQLVNDHFVLSYESKNDPDRPPEHLANLCEICPLFASLFITIVLDMLANNLIDKLEHSLKKLLDLFNVWLNKSCLLPLLAYRINASHASSYMLNPLPGLLYLTVIFPLKNYTDSFKQLALSIQEKLPTQQQSMPETDSSNNLNNDYDEQVKIVKEELDEFKKVQSSLNELIFRIHFITLKLLMEISKSASKSLQQDQNANHNKLINLKHAEYVLKQFEESNDWYADGYSSNISKITSHLNVTKEEEDLKQTFWQLKNECLEKLAQLLELCWQFDFATFSKSEIKSVYEKMTSSSHNKDIECELMEIVLNTPSA